MSYLKSIENNGVLFPPENWDYFCYCTDIVDNPLQIHRIYGDRGTSGNWIENVKTQMFAGQLLTNDFCANEAMWLSSVMAYNISVDEKINGCGIMASGACNFQGLVCPACRESSEKRQAGIFENVRGLLLQGQVVKDG